jgi:ATP-binding cassette, subfamily B, bacterial
MVISTIIREGSAIVVALAVRLAINAALGGHDELVALALVVGGGFGALAIGSFAFALRAEVMDRTTFEVEHEIGQLAAEIPSIEHLSGGDYQDRIVALRENVPAIARAPEFVAMNVAHVGQLLATIGLLASLQVRLLLLVPAAIPALVLGSWGRRKVNEAIFNLGQPRRMQDAILGLVGNASNAGELRTLGADYVQNKFADLSRQSRRPVASVARSFTIAMTGGWIFFGLTLVLVLHWIFATNAQALSPGDLVFALTLSVQLNTYVGSTTTIANSLSRSYLAAASLLWLRTYAATQVDEASLAPPHRLEQGIELRNVGFRYRSSERDALAGVDLRLSAGSVVAIVGDNGAGKSSLLGLLTRILNPTTGNILVDGVDLSSFRAELWLQRVSSVFQDAAALELSVSENVGVGYLPGLNDRERINEAIGLASASDFLRILPDGLDTLLGVTSHDGHELSGGEWQRIAVARAFRRPRPLLRILDEPTASLDPATEAALYDAYIRSARSRGAESGTVTIIVSHRLNGITKVDRIIVLHEGKVAEQGTHTELISSGGYYAQAFARQKAALAMDNVD